MGKNPEHTTSDADSLVRIVARAHERDRYLAALLAPRPVRDRLITLAAFAGEISRIPTSVSEQMMGEIRLQWWRDALDHKQVTTHGADDATGHPVADAMRSVVLSGALRVEELDALLDATGRLLEDRPHRSVLELIATVDQIDGTIFRSAARIATGGEPESAELRVIANAAEAYGLSRALVEAPIVALQGRFLLPNDGSDEIIRRAETCLALVRAEWRSLSRGVQVALLPVALVGPYLQVSRNPDRVGAGPQNDVLPMTRVWRLWMAHLLRRI